MVDQQNDGLFFGPFFANVAEFTLEVGGDFVVIERVWENTGFPMGTDAEAFRTVLDHRPQILPGQIGAFLLRREEAVLLSQALDVLMERMMAVIDANTERGHQLIPYEEGFDSATVYTDTSPKDVRYPGFDHQRPDEAKTDRREPAE